jgi:hypothetical protein
MMIDRRAFDPRRESVLKRGKSYRHDHSLLKTPFLSVAYRSDNYSEVVLTVPSMHDEALGISRQYGQG